MQLFLMAWFVFIVKFGLHLIIADYFLHCTGKQKRRKRNFQSCSQNHTQNPGEAAAFFGFKVFIKYLRNDFYYKAQTITKKRNNKR
jgi:hypothetical protein